MRKNAPPLLLAALLFGCSTHPQTPPTEALVMDTLARAEVPTEPSEPIVPASRKLVVGFAEWDLYFYHWGEGFVLNYPGEPLNDNNSTEPVRLAVSKTHERQFRLEVQLWTNVKRLAIDESEHHVGKFAASRTVSGNGNLSYSFETDGMDGLGAIVYVTDLVPETEHWLTENFSATINEATDSLVSLVSSPFPLQVPRPVQTIGITFQMESYHDGTFPRTKVWLRLTNFSNYMTNRKMIADVIGAVENTTDGKPTLNEGEALVLKNFYGGLGTEWRLVNEGDNLVLYEQTEDEPSMESEQDKSTIAAKKLMVLPVSKDLDFEFVGYFPMGE